MKTFLAASTTRNSPKRSQTRHLWDPLRRPICLEQCENSHEHRQGDAVKKDVTQYLAFGSSLTGSDAGDDNALGIDHFSHDAPRTVGSRREDRGNPEALGGDLLEVAEQNVGGCVASGERDAQPTQYRREEREELSGTGKGQSHRRILPGVARGEADR